MKYRACAMAMAGLPLWNAAALAAELNVTIELPRLDVAEYHRPYVAMWLERPDQSVAGNLAVWYDVNKKDQGGTKWLKDLRQWWRKTGRDTKMPVDGISGATRAPGQHRVRFDSTHPTLRDLAPGNYQVVIEAAREAGGREVLRVPMAWPADEAHQLRGREELGNVNVQPRP